MTFEPFTKNCGRCTRSVRQIHLNQNRLLKYIRIKFCSIEKTIWFLQQFWCTDFVQNRLTFYLNIHIVDVELISGFDNRTEPIHCGNET